MTRKSSVSSLKAYFYEVDDTNGETTKRNDWSPRYIFFSSMTRYCCVSCLPISCSRCLSSAHHRHDCSNSVGCVFCFRMGYAAAHCRFPPRFPGLDALPSFASPASCPNLTTWFTSPVRPTDVSI
jgi:hypothetical protein